MLRNILKGFALVLFTVVGVVLFQYIGESKLDILVIVLFSLFMFCTTIVFYESAFRRNYRLFFVVLLLTFVFSAFFIYRKMLISKEKKLCRDVVLMNRELRDHELRYNKINIDTYKFDDEADSKKDKEESKDKKSNHIETSVDNSIKELNKEIESFKKDLDNGLAVINKHRSECMKILADVHVALISKSKKIDIMKCLDNYYNYKGDIEKNYKELKDKRDKLTKKMDELVKKRDEEIKKKKEVKVSSTNDDTNGDSKIIKESTVVNKGSKKSALNKKK